MCRNHTQYLHYHQTSVFAICIHTQLTRTVLFSQSDCESMHIKSKPEYSTWLHECQVHRQCQHNPLQTPSAMTYQVLPYDSLIAGRAVTGYLVGLKLVGLSRPFLA